MADNIVWAIYWLITSGVLQGSAWVLFSSSFLTDDISSVATTLPSTPDDTEVLLKSTPSLPAASSRLNACLDENTTWMTDSFLLTTQQTSA